MSATESVSDGARPTGRVRGSWWPRRSATRASICCASSFDVELGVGWSREELAERIGEYDGILIRSATKLDAELIGRAARLRAVGRAGVGVDNVDVDAATKRGIIVANAPQSNVITAAEHTMALLLALARNVPQAHASLTGGKWERSKFSGIELYEKTLGILGFGRIGQLVAERALALRHARDRATTRTSPPSATASSASRRPSPPTHVYAAADFITLHLPNTPETKGWLDAEALREVQGRRAHPERRARPAGRRRRSAGGARLRQGRRRGARRVHAPSRSPTIRCSAIPNVIVTPHLGASTAEATDRAGYQAAEQVVAALTGGVVTSAVNVPAISAEDMDVLGPFVSCAARWAGSRSEVARGLVDRPACEIEFLGRIAERDTRLLTIQVLLGVLRGHTEEEVNEVNAPALAHERGIEVVEMKRSAVRDYSDLVRVTVEQWRDERAGRRDPARPAQPRAPARGVGPALQHPARGAHDGVPLPRHAGHDRPRRHALRRRTASTSSRPRSDVIRTPPSARGCEAVMVITTDAAVAADGDRRDRGPRRVRGRSRRDLVACAAAPGIACAGGPGIVR